MVETFSGLVAETTGTINNQNNNQCETALNNN